MPITFRQIRDNEFSRWRELVRRGFNEFVHPDDIARLRNDRAELDRLFGAFDGEELVGTGGADSYLLTVPGGAQLPTAGIAYMTTAATHRRRGILTNVMGNVLEQAQERGEPLAALWASESAIYSRFGFGQATVSEDWEIDPARSAFAHRPDLAGIIRFVDHDEALRLMPVVWDQARKRRAGFVDRSERRWRYVFFDEERVRGPWSGIFFVVHESGGVIDGYAAYRLRPIDPVAEDELAMKVVEVVATSDAAHAALWRFLFDVDLVTSVSSNFRPPDDPVWWMLADPRRMKRTPADGLWLRVLDPVAALSARSYSAQDTLFIEVRDDYLKSGGGTFELAAAHDGAECRRSTREPDLAMTPGELSSAYLGGVRLSELARAGRVEERADGAIRRFDRMFATDRAPWCPHYF